MLSLRARAKASTKVYRTGLRISNEMVDKTQFQVKGNLPNTPGKIILLNELIELIQYEPMTEEVHEILIVITPPWIKKFYFLDLKPQ